MTPTHLHPYLNFHGNCRDAMMFYQSVLGGTLTMQTFGEAPMPSSEEDKEKIMHAMLECDGFTIMASDSMPGFQRIEGNNVNLSLVGSDTGLQKTFEELSKGGTVTMKLEKQFWGDTFGTLTDKFGIHWMVNIGGA